MKQIKGFTLVELVITIAIVIVLSTISVPIYRHHMIRAQKVEGYTLISRIRDAQIAYYNEYRNFLFWGQSSAGSKEWTANEEVLGINAIGNKYFTWFDVCWNSVPKYMFKAYASGKGGLLGIVYNVTTGGTWRETFQY